MAQRYICISKAQAEIIIEALKIAKASFELVGYSPDTDTPSAIRAQKRSYEFLNIWDYLQDSIDDLESCYIPQKPVTGLFDDIDLDKIFPPVDSSSSVGPAL